MENEFIYWKHLTPAGIKVEEICGADNRSMPVWHAIAMQIYGENAEDYRKVGHFANGAPFLYGDTCRISITHTGRFLAVASLPRTPEATLGEFSTRTAMGIDAERLDREQVLKVRERYLSEEELSMISAESTEANVKAWTAKEAMYKAAMTEGLDFRRDIRIIELPEFGIPTAVKGRTAPAPGKGEVTLPGGEKVALDLYAYESEGCCVMLAYSPKCAKFSVK